MNTRLQPMNLTDYTGGLNARENRFQVADNESPSMLNVHVDTRGGFFTRAGNARVGALDVVGTWAPRHAKFHPLASGSSEVFVTNEGTVYHLDASGNLVDGAVLCNATPHLADFASWGDGVYIATGAQVDAVGGTPVLWTAGAPTPLFAAGTGRWNEDFAVPVGGVMPQAELCEPHSGYLFAANTKEDGTPHPSRLRWSHPTQPGDWSQLDFIDIEAGGGRITGLRSYSDHLLIFKTDSMWALYGYDSESWQLIKKSRSIGVPSPTAIARSPSALYFYSGSGRGGIYGYGGDEPVSISEPLRTVITGVIHHTNVWLGWVANRLLCNLPWIASTTTASPIGTGNTSDTTMFAFDPEIGEGGAWEAHRPAQGSLGPIIEESDISDDFPLAVLFRDPDDRACLLRLGSLSQAYDIHDALPTPLPFDVYYTTNWKDHGWPELRKSWRRPRFIIRNPTDPFSLRVESYRDYDTSAPRRIGILTIPASGRPFWRDLGAADPAGDGFDWDDGTLWAGSTEGSRIERGSSFGHCRALQLRISPTTNSLGKTWGVDAIILKVIARRFTT